MIVIGSGAIIGNSVDTTVEWSDLIKTPFRDTANFISTVKSLAEKYDWNVKIPLMIASNETGFGKSCYHYSLFNITTKFGSYFKYPSIPDLKFRKYNSYAESVTHLWNLLKSDRYRTAWENRHNPEQAIREMIKAGYSNKDNANAYLNTLSTINRHG